MVHNVDRGEPINRHLYHLYGLLPSDPRCKLCAAPFKDWGGIVMHLLGRDQSKYNPRFCQPCEKFERPGGTEGIIAILFADVRGSTTLAEQMSAREFSRLINRFYTVATHVRIQTEADPGEILISETGFSAAHLEHENLEHRQLELKGNNEPIGVYVLRLAQA